MSAQLYIEPRPAGPGVDEWRFQQLLAAGWLEDEALVLAARHDADLHLACELLERGCDPDLAWRILY